MYLADPTSAQAPEPQAIPPEPLPPRAGYANPNYDDGQTAPQLSERQIRCRQLEHALVQRRQNSGNAGKLLPQLRAEQRKLEAEYQRARYKAERSNCYEFFFFSKTLKRTRKCVALDKNIKEVEIKLTRIQRDIVGLKDRRVGKSQRQRLIAALARNGCGQVYQRQARLQRRRQQQSWNPFRDFFGGGFRNESYYDNAPRSLAPEGSIVADATYRTMCVRLCDGYYFPVSYQTLPSKFGQDQSICGSRCAAPSSLFVYRNPGSEVEQMISLDGAPYSELPNAYRYRRDYIKGCSCKADQYDPITAEGEPENALDGNNEASVGDKQRGKSDQAANASRSHLVPSAPVESAADSTALARQ